MRVTVVLAGGSGSRSGVAGNKVFVELAGVSVLRRSVTTALAVSDHVVVVVPDAELEAASTHLEDTDVHLCAGGQTRQLSETAGIKRAIELGAAASEDLIAVHDAARPLASVTLFEDVFQRAADHRAAYSAIERGGIWRINQAGELTEMVDGQHFAAQTPQACRADVLAETLHSLVDASGATDTIDMLALYAPDSPTAVPVAGEATNIKVTWPDDIALAESLIAASNATPADKVDAMNNSESSVGEFASLDQTEAALSDAQVALDCLAVAGTEICATCRAAEADGTLGSRPALQRCVTSKRADSR